MNKVQLTETVARETGLSRVEAKKAVDASIRIAVEAFRNGEKLTLSGLGTFSVVQKPERLGRNPRTGGSVPIPARKVLKFRSTLELE